MKPPMTIGYCVTLVFMFLASTLISTIIIWAAIHYALPWIVDRIQEQIDSRFKDKISWTTGIIQEPPTPRRDVYANHVEYVWE